VPLTLGTCHAKNTSTTAQGLVKLHICVPALVRAYTSFPAPIRTSYHQHAFLPGDRVASPGVVPDRHLCFQSLHSSPLRTSTFILPWSTMEFSKTCEWAVDVHSCCARVRRQQRPQHLESIPKVWQEWKGHLPRHHV
jgi:hypothetical protein